MVREQRASNTEHSIHVAKRLQFTKDIQGDVVSR